VTIANVRNTPGDHRAAAEPGQRPATRATSHAVRNAAMSDGRRMASTLQPVSQPNSPLDQYSSGGLSG
jgi:hypothetical protein